MPTSILNYVEGTRFTQKKHDAQESPYAHLLRPRAGGLAYTIAAMGEMFASLLDVTILYPDGETSVWDLMCGRLRRVTVHVQERAIPEEFLDGDYLGDSEYRARFQAWVQEMWQEKDALLSRLTQEQALVPA